MILNDGTIVINGNDLVRGQAVSPHTGLASVRNLELFDTPGIAKIQYRTTLSFATTGLPTCIKKDVFGNTYVGTDQGYLYKNKAVLQSGLGVIYDLDIFEDYLIITRQTVASVYGPLSSGGAAFFSNWKTGFTNGYYHKIAIPGNEKVYIANGASIASLSNFSGGTVGVAPTATLDLVDLDLRDGRFAQTIAPLSQFIAIGTHGGSSFVDTNHGIGDLFFWDKSSPSFEYPLELHESGINQLLTLGNRVLAHAGVFGHIYTTNTADFDDDYKTINFNTDNNASAFLYPNAIAKVGNEVLIGTSTGNDSFPSKSVHGIYSLKGRIAYLRNTISSGNWGMSSNLKIGVIYPLNSGGIKTFLIGWQDGTSYGVDEIDSDPYDNYQAFFETDLYKVGTRKSPKKYDDLELLLAKPFVQGQNLRLSYRTNLTDDFTVMETYNRTNVGAGKYSMTDKVKKVPQVDQIQLKVEFSQDTSVSFGNNIEFKELVIR